MYIMSEGQRQDSRCHGIKSLRILITPAAWSEMDSAWMNVTSFAELISIYPISCLALTRVATSLTLFVVRVVLTILESV
jgi:hypothetical protein